MTPRIGTFFILIQVCPTVHAFHNLGFYCPKGIDSRKTNIYTKKQYFEVQLLKKNIIK